MIMRKRKVLKPSEGAAAVVTGAANGIGRCFAYEIVRRGGSVICVDIDEELANKTAEELSELGEGRAIGYKCDVADEEQMRVLSEQAETLLGRPVTLLINNAGIAVAGSIGEQSLDDWRAAIDVNLWGVVYGCHYFVPKLRDLGFGGIINVASAAGFAAIPGTAAYSASKAAVLAMSEALAGEMTGSGVHVTTLCPTAVNTNILERGRMNSGINEFTNKIKDNWVFVASPENVASGTLDALDRNNMYFMPQFDSRLGWRLKRYAPRTYARALGEIYRLTAS